MRNALQLGWIAWLESAIRSQTVRVRKPRQTVHFAEQSNPALQHGPWEQAAHEVAGGAKQPPSYTLHTETAPTSSRMTCEMLSSMGSEDRRRMRMPVVQNSRRVRREVLLSIFTL